MVPFSILNLLECGGVRSANCVGFREGVFTPFLSLAVPFSMLNLLDSGGVRSGFCNGDRAASFVFFLVGVVVCTSLLPNAFFRLSIC